MEREAFAQVDQAATVGENKGKKLVRHEKMDYRS
jgi:hypothetical protein